MTEDVSLEEAQARSFRNPFSKWPERREANRLEPECWPGLNPSFNIDRQDKLFAIGSCFARNIEGYLARNGFNVPAAKLYASQSLALEAGAEILNKYTPPSIWQELNWTKRILDRDGIVTLDDVEPFLLELKSGKVIDLQRRFLDRHGSTREQAVEQRQWFFDLFRLAFEADVVVITLGLLECWWDRRTDEAIEWAPVLKDYDREGRFVFRQLDYPECYEFVRKTIELINGNGEKRILLTTSPIPIVRTFTSDDVIVANTYSKSVLRAVAGRIAKDFPTLDYFPSFESVMLTKRPEVWEDDLAHVEADFVDRIMRRVVGAYVQGAQMTSEEAVKDTTARLFSVVKRRDWQEAGKLLLEIEAIHREAPDNQLPYAYHVAACAYLTGTGQLDDARRTLTELDRLIAQPNRGERRPDHVMLHARLVEALGDAEGAEQLRLSAMQGANGKPAWLKARVHDLWVADQAEDAHWVMNFIQANYPRHPDLMEFLVDICFREKRYADAEELLHKIRQDFPDDLNFAGRHAHTLTLLERNEEALEILEGMGKGIIDHPRFLRLLAAEHLKARRPETAEPLILDLLRSEPGEAHNHAMLSRCYLQLQRWEDALEPARRAYEIDQDERFAQLLAQVESLIARKSRTATPAA